MVACLSHFNNTITCKSKLKLIRKSYYKISYWFPLYFDFVDQLLAASNFYMILLKAYHGFGYSENRPIYQTIETILCKNTEFLCFSFTLIGNLRKISLYATPVLWNKEWIKSPCNLIQMAFMLGFLKLLTSLFLQ